jgi:hypothetical protein
MHEHAGEQDEHGEDHGIENKQRDQRDLGGVLVGLEGDRRHDGAHLPTTGAHGLGEQASVGLRVALPRGARRHEGVDGALHARRRQRAVDGTGALIDPHALVEDRVPRALLDRNLPAAHHDRGERGLAA